MEGPTWLETRPNEFLEFQLIWTFLNIQRELEGENRLFAEPLDLLEGVSSPELPQEQQETEHESLAKSLKRAWIELQSFYISQARIIFCTASSAGRKSLWNYKPVCIVMEEASQMTETTCLNAMAKYYPSTQKIILSGDPNQLPPTVTSLARNECYESEKLSLLERLWRSGLRATQLQVQHRMHPDIAEFVSREFYASSLINYQSSLGRYAAQWFRMAMHEYVQKWNADCVPANSYFASVEDSSVWQRQGYHSMFNPEYVTVVAELVELFKSKNCPQNQILVLTYYAEEQRILSELLHGRYSYSGIRIESVDASQGHEREIVILSTCRPGGEFGLGFVADIRRQNMAMSRAKDGLLIVGHERMGGGNTSSGYRSWRSATDYFRDNKRLINVPGCRDLLEDKLKIPNSMEYQQLRKPF